MNQIIITYTLYLVLTIGLTIWVAKTLFKNGRVFLYDIFHGNKELADSVNNLLLVGFYLINLGYAIYTLQIHEDVLNFQQVLEKLSIKIGLIILILGAMHFLNLYIFFKLRNRAISDNKKRVLNTQQQ
ncbi:MAG: hypothetical protein H7Y86_11975 [Rhizobacter sp.]|nr:hypothetical protein [Ferruginibacter sp.]